LGVSLDSTSTHIADRSAVTAADPRALVTTIGEPAVKKLELTIRAKRL
jgi:hypothetical protein